MTKRGQYGALTLNATTDANKNPLIKFHTGVNIKISINVTQPYHPIIPIHQYKPSDCLEKISQSPSLSASSALMLR